MELVLELDFDQRISIYTNWTLENMNIGYLTCNITDFWNSVNRFYHISADILPLYIITQVQEVNRPLVDSEPNLRD